MQAQLPPRSGMGCFAKGCLTLVIAFFLLAIVCVGGFWFVFHRAARVFTSTEPEMIAVQQSSPAEIQTAEAKKRTFLDAVHNNQATTVEFTAADLNALIATDRDFHAVRNHSLVSIANSLVTLQLSAPLDSLKLKMFRGRWFNGRLMFGFNYADENLSVDVKSGEANGHQISDKWLNPQVQSAFNSRLNQDLRERHGEHDAWLSHVKTASVQDDRIIVTTRGP